MPSIINKIRPWIWTLVWFTLPFSLKANTYCLILFGIITVISAFYEKPKINKAQYLLIGIFFLFFLWHAASFFFDPEKYLVWKNLERKLSFLFIPILLALFIDDQQKAERWAIQGFVAGLTVSGLHMFSLALFRIFEGHRMEMWTYHNFTGPYQIGAIYYSWYLSIAMIYLVTKKPIWLTEKLRYVVMLFFLVLLLLSSSKLFIILTLPVLAWQFFNNWNISQSKTKYLLLGLVVVILAFGAVPFSSRISEIRETNFEVLSEKHFNYDTPFNGLTIRLLQWRFAFEILNDRNAWLTGTGIGSRQKVLDSYYIKYNVYHGNPDLGDTGYLGYNFHNQYIETLVGTGIPGLILLVILILYIFTRPYQTLMYPLVVYIFVLIFFITESVLERQAGIVLFCLLWATTFTNKNTTITHGNYVSHTP